MNRTLLIALALTALVGVIALVLPWMIAGDRYTARVEVTATVGTFEGLTPSACANGKGYPKPFKGVYFVLPGNAPRLMVDTGEGDRPVRVRVEHAGREVAAVIGVKHCATMTGAVTPNGITAHKVEGVDGTLDVACTLPDGKPLQIKGSFRNCFRP